MIAERQTVARLVSSVGYVDRHQCRFTLSATATSIATATDGRFPIDIMDGRREGVAWIDW